MLMERVRPPGHAGVRGGEGARVRCGGADIGRFRRDEKAKDVWTVSASFEWSDVGGWRVAADLVAPDAQGDRARGTVVLEDCHDTFVLLSDPQLPILCVGMQDVLVVGDAGRHAGLSPGPGRQPEAAGGADSGRAASSTPVSSAPVLRPMGYGEILDKTFDVYRDNFLLMAAIMALVHIPSVS